MEKLTPMGDKVIVKTLVKEETSRGGIIIPDTAKEKPQEGEIVAVGPGRTGKKGDLIPMTVKVGDKIIFAKYTGSEITSDGEKYLIMPESDILALTTPGAAAEESKSAAKETATKPRSKAKGK